MRYGKPVVAKGSPQELGARNPCISARVTYVTKNYRGNEKLSFVCNEVGSRRV